MVLSIGNPARGKHITNFVNDRKPGLLSGANRVFHILKYGVRSDVTASYEIPNERRFVVGFIAALIA